MKRMFITLAIGAAAMGVLAQPPTPAPAPAAIPSPAPPIVKKVKTQIQTPTSTTVFTPITVFKPVVHKKIERVDGMSSRPWAQTVGWHPGESAFPRPELLDPSMPIVWTGHEPWQQ
jgi:hypothetical protein